MKIGVDAGALGITDERLKVGVYRVTLSLLRQLGRMDPHNTYILYSFDTIDRGVMDQFGPNMENRVLWPVKGWFRLRLPLELRLHPVDLFLGVSQGIPSFAKRTIGFIYDVGFLFHPEAYPKSYGRLKNQTKRLARKATRIITISESVKTDIQNVYSMPDDKITVAHPGVDDRFTEKGPAHKAKNPYFLFVGALKPGKNVPFIIKAFARFLEEEQKTYDLYLIGGDFWKDKKIEATIGARLLENRVKRLGFIPDDELPEYYRGAVSLVTPSLHEGFCLPAVEAMASGCPVIGSTTGALPEIVGDAGILVDPTSVSGLVRAMQQIVHDPKRKTQMIKRGLARSKQFSWKKFTETVYNTIHET